ncbi:MAG: hypothetical protein ACRDOG_08070 [Gaiellaceae bacterium]
MQRPIDFSKVVPTHELSGEDAESDRLLEEMIERGRAYLSDFDWCGEIVESYVGDIAIGGVVAVLLFKIVPTRKGVDEWVWVIVGDLPPAYITLDVAPNPACALDGYVGALREWVDAVKEGRSVEGLIPVETQDGSAVLEPRLDVANALENRLDSVDSEVLANYEDDLRATRKPTP